MVQQDPITGMEYDVERPRHWGRWRVNDDWGRNFYGRTLEKAMERARSAPDLPDHGDWITLDSERDDDTSPYMVDCCGSNGTVTYFRNNESETAEVAYGGWKFSRHGWCEGSGQPSKGDVDFRVGKCPRCNANVRLNNDDDLIREHLVLIINV